MLEKRVYAKRIATLAYASDNPFRQKYFIFSVIKRLTPMKYFHRFLYFLFVHETVYCSYPLYYSSIVCPGSTTSPACLCFASNNATKVAGSLSITGHVL